MLAFDQQGTGVPIVLLHAYPLNRSMWREQIANLSRNFHVISIDLPGFGASPVQGDISTMESMAAQAYEVIQSLKLQSKFISVGLSMGGYMSFPLYKLAKDQIRAVALISTKATPDTAEGKQKRYFNAEKVQKEGAGILVDIMPPSLLGKTTLAEKPEVVAEVKKIIGEAQAPGVIGALKGMAERPDSTNVLFQITVPTFVVSGVEDTVIPTEAMAKMATQIPKAEFQKIEKAGHLLTMEQPAQFNDLFRHFLKRHVL